MEIFRLFGSIFIENDMANASISATGKEAEKTAGKLSELGQEGEKTESRLGKAFKKVGNVAVAIGKTIATGLAVGTTAMAGLTVKALDLGAELEQNIGGSEAVFKEYADNMQKVANEAYHNMGLSASNFLATANKMGALFQGSGFTIQESADMTAAAMQRAADIASIMGIDVQAAMDAVAGAAKGNFTMMDNLGVAMNDTTIKAYALEKGLIQAGDQMTLQQKIAAAMQMFLEKSAYATGNYAKENETLAGALTTTKAALQNFLSGSGDVEGLLSSLENLADVVMGKLDELLPRLTTGIAKLIEKALPKLPQMLQKVLPILIKAATDIINGLVAVLPGLTKALLDATPEIIAGLIVVIEEIVRNLPMIISPLIKALPTLIPQLVEGLVQLVLTLTQNIMPIVMPIIEALPTILDSIMQALISALPQIVSGLISLMLAVVKNMPTIIKSLLDSIPVILTGVIDALMAALPQLIEGLIMLNLEIVKNLPVIIYELIKAIPTIHKSVIDALMKSAPMLWSSFKDIFGKAWDKVKEVFSSVKDFFNEKFGAGANAIKNAFSGIKGFFSNLFEGVKEVVKKPINWIISGINSFIKGINKIKIPDWVPIVGGKGLNLKEIPLLAFGGEITQKGHAIVGEAGPELLELPQGAKVKPLNNDFDYDRLASVIAEQVGNLNGQIVIENMSVRDETDIEKIAQKLYELQTRRLRVGGAFA